MSQIDQLVQKAKAKYCNSNYISTGKLQREMKMPYDTASKVLDIMVDQNFASPRVGAYPCTVLRGHFKILKKYFAILKTKLIFLFSIREDPDIFLH